MIARTEEFAFHRLNDLQWRFGILEPPPGHSITIGNSQKDDYLTALFKLGFVIVKQENNEFIAVGRAVEVDLDPVIL